MMLKRLNLNLLRWAILWAAFTMVDAALAQNVILHLRNGDRIAGTIISENTNQVTVSTVWIKELAVPLAQIERRELSATNTVLTVKTSAPAVVVTTVLTNKPAATNAVTAALAKPVVPPPKPSWFKRWKGDVSVGADLVYGATDRQLYHGHLGLTYSQPYEHNPQKFFRDVLNFNAEYGKTDGVLSANRMDGSSKTDFDVGRKIYVYNLVGAGYDEIRKIDIRYEVGPGVGYHLFTKTNYVMNVELGSNYQAEYRSDNTRSENFYARIAEDITWKLNKTTALVEKFELFPQLGNSTQYRARFEATLSHSILSNLSLNLTLLDLYDTRPASAVPHNEVQVRSSLGFKF
ncbi:MAG: hypothetical protein JWQ71_1770 [Pedosphaera sp.]|nr:hypothetical protein [Pedosphaera sp.]